jgi:hypothetical protein
VKKELHPWATEEGHERSTQDAKENERTQKKHGKEKAGLTGLSRFTFVCGCMAARVTEVLYEIDFDFLCVFAVKGFRFKS